MKTLILLSLFLFTFSLFSAVTLINKDKQSYKLFIENEKQSAFHTSISENATRMACQKACKIIIKENKNKIQAKDGETILIKDGKLSKK